MLETGFISIGIILFVLIVIFKKQINRFYDNMKGLPEKHAKFYKNIVVYIVPVIFILFGIFLLIAKNLDEETKQLIKYNLENNVLNFYFIGGILLILFGFTTAIIKLTDYKYKAFAKLAVMEEKYGKITGNIIHLLFYSLVPIAIGAYWLYQILFMS